MQTLKEVEKFCEDNEIELSVERGAFTTHVHVNIDAPGKVFRAHELHNLGLWDDSKKPNWSSIGKELLAADFGDCTDANCEYCAANE
jgi:hypothetical protein